MKKTLALLVVSSAILLMAGCATTTIPPFGAELGSMSNPIPFMDRIRVPYNDTVSYFGYIKPGSAPDAVVQGKKMYYIYVWIPAVAPELGIRMMSPAPSSMQPTAKDFVSPLWAAGSKDTANYFDTWVSWERALAVINPEDIASKAATTIWLPFDSNDDSSELPAQPSGSQYNSVLRIVSSPTDPVRSLIRGLYRIGFTSFKSGDVQGSFWAQIGVPFKIEGVEITATLAEMAKVAR
jgi:hypothetical protein